MYTICRRIRDASARFTQERSKNKTEQKTHAGEGQGRQQRSGVGHADVRRCPPPELLPLLLPARSTALTVGNTVHVDVGVSDDVTCDRHVSHLNEALPVHDVL